MYLVILQEYLQHIFLFAFLNCSLDKVRDYIFLEADYLLNDVDKF